MANSELQAVPERAGATGGVAVPPAPAPAPRRPLRGAGGGREFMRQGIPAIWFSGVMALYVAMLLVGMVVLILANGLRHFWPSHVERVQTETGAWMGPVVESQTGHQVRQRTGSEAVGAGRILLKVGNRDV